MFAVDAKLALAQPRPAAQPQGLGRSRRSHRPTTPNPCTSPLPTRVSAVALRQDGGKLLVGGVGGAQLVHHHLQSTYTILHCIDMQIWEQNGAGFFLMRTWTLSQSSVNSNRMGGSHKGCGTVRTSAHSALYNSTAIAPGMGTRDCWEGNRSSDASRVAQGNPLSAVQTAPAGAVVQACCRPTAPVTHLITRVVDLVRHPLVLQGPSTAVRSQCSQLSADCRPDTH